MIQKIDSNSLFLADHGWLKSRFHFSFAEYYDPARMHFGALRVLNDDIVQPGSGFPPHPHRDMEIVSYVLRGELTHQDNMGNRETLGRGSVQYMTAGTGVVHSEFNEGGDGNLRFLQTWILPDKPNREPRYGSRQFAPEKRRNAWLTVVSADGRDDSVLISQDASIQVAELDAGKDIQSEIGAGRLTYLVLAEGEAKVLDGAGNEIAMGERDALAITGPETVSIHAGTDAHLFRVETAAT